MLIITRTIGRSIVIGDDINLTILGIQGNQVRLGINAPRDIPVHRDEIYSRIQLEKKQGNEKSGLVNENVVLELVDEKFTKASNEAVVH